MNETPSVDLSPRRRRLLRSILPAGAILFVLWLGLAAFSLVSGTGEPWWAAVWILGLINSITLIGVGRQWRRDGPP